MRAKLLLSGLVAGLVVLVGVAPRAQTVGQPGPAGPAQAPAPAERKLQLAFDGNGYVTLVAHNVTVPQVFAEWARIGGSKIQGADKLPQTQIVVDFDKTPELQLIEALVRLSHGPNAGWIASPRLLTDPPTLSRLATISILPSSSPTASTYMNTSTSQAPIYQQNTPDDELPPVMPPVGPGPASAPQPSTAPPATRGPGAAVPIVGVPSPSTPATNGGRGSEVTPLPGGGRGGGGGSR